MAFTDRLRKRISSPVGFAGGTLEEQLLRAAQGDQATAPQPERGGFIREPQPTMAESAMARVVEPQPAPALAQPMARSRSFKDALSRPTQAPTGSFEPPQPTQTTDLGQGRTFTEGGTDDVRGRRAEPRDFIADDEAYLRDLRNKPRTWRDKLVDVTDALNVVAGGQKRILPTKREREIGEVENRIGQGLAIDRSRLPKASERGQISTRVVNEGEYPDVEAGTEIRVRIDPRTGEPTDMIGANKRPVVAGLPKKGAERAPHYDKDAEGYLITVQDGKSKRVVNEKGEPVQVKKSGDEEFVEVEVNGRKLKVTPAQALNYYGQTGEQEIKRTAAQREALAKRTAKLNESSTLYKKADNLAEEAKKLHGQPDPYGDVAKRIMEYEKEARDLRVKGDAARADGEAIPVATEQPPAATGGKYAGQRIATTKLADAAKRLNMTIEKVKEYLQSEGAEIY